MPGITTPYNLQMPSAGLIGRGSGAGRSAIMDAAAIRTLTDTLTSTEVGSAISAGLATIDLSGKVSKSGDTMTGLLAITQATANTGVIASTGYSLTGTNATSAINFAGTWNTTGTPTLVKYNVTDTASNAASLLFDLQVGGTSKFKVDKEGGITGTEIVTFTIATTAYWDCAAGKNIFIRSKGGILSLTDGNQTMTLTSGACLLSSTTPRTLGGVSAITASGTLTLKNSTTAVLAEISKTYTSSTDREYLGLGYVSGISAYFLGSRRAASGSNQALKIGHLAADGTTFTGMTVDTAGVVTSLQFTASGGNVYFAETRISRRYDGVLMIQGSTDTCRLQFGGTTSAFPEIQRSGTGVKFRLADDSADANLTCGAIIASGIVSVSASTTARASINLPSGTAPTSPTDGDIWSNGSDLKVRLGGVTYTLTKA